eukprot:TRINITY_DN49249_c0_g1_i1.p1 TRINITY_DN49249_c0_g1~~TRINITY_DN49249_c0_g1_i1.p1  ORF type:complete len:157 (+),score=39.89 TRINITY_DN49249_c0_g1_i1:110-580(+)
MSAPGGEMPAAPSVDPRKRISVEDKVFLEDFGRRLSMAAGGAFLAGGGAAYAFATYAGRRKGRWTVLGATVSSIAAWASVVNAERDNVKAMAEKMQMGTATLPDVTAMASQKQKSDEEVLAKLFPPPPSAGLQAQGQASDLLGRPAGARPPGSFGF